MSSSNIQKSTVQALNAYLVAALLSLFITGTFLILLGLFFGVEQINSSSEMLLFQNLSITVIIFGFILITLGMLESLGIISKIKKGIDVILEKGDFGQSIQQINSHPSTGIGGGVRIIRPAMTMSESAPQKYISSASSKVPPVHVRSPEPIISKTITKTDKQKTEILDITLEEALQKIIDRYNDPKVSKAFSNWRNTLMMTFKDLDKSYIFKINSDESIELMEGIEEDAAVQVNLDSQIFIKMMTKQINPIKAYSSGGLEVKGKMRNLLKLRKLMF
ncbi:MAG: SCP2 sterol-binding domain-containing protein [Promethearchaeota archaeon]